MSLWKQIAISIVLLLVAAGAWAKFFPGAPQVLARWGISLASTAPEKGGGATTGATPRQNSGALAPNVATAPVGNAIINDRLAAIGTGRALSSVTVNPFASGRLVETTVTPGQHVKAGDVIARLDAEAEQIALDRARIALDDATARLDRVKSLRSSNAATTVQVSDAELVSENARLALRDAQLTLDRRVVLAPISGIVGVLPVATGNNVSTTTVLATIDDRSRIIVDFWVPERYASAISVGAALTVVPIARPSESLPGTVSAIDNLLDEKSRTLLVQAAIANADDTLRAGMSFQVAMSFPGDAYPSVDPLAIQWGADGAFVWAVRDGKAKRTPVRIIQRNTESVLVEAKLAEGDVVITEGVQSVRDGAAIQTASNATPAPDSKQQPITGNGS